MNEKVEQTKFDINSIKLVVGLGNPGKEYIKTRHNAGFIFLDLLSSEFLTETKFKAEISNINSPKKIVLAKPTTYMNASGESVIAISNFYKILPAEILVIHDDLDVKLGEYKIQFNKGPKVHNGILSIENLLATSAFWRMRVGIDNRTEELRKLISGSDYVLGRFSPDELDLLTKTLIAAKESLFN